MQEVRGSIPLGSTKLPFSDMADVKTKIFAVISVWLFLSFQNECVEAAEFFRFGMLTLIFGDFALCQGR